VFGIGTGKGTVNRILSLISTMVGLVIDAVHLITFFILLVEH
jgi:hypothetical protein